MEYNMKMKDKRQKMSKFTELGEVTNELEMGEKPKIDNPVSEQKTQTSNVNIWVIVGIVVGIIILLFCAIGIPLFIRHRKRVTIDDDIPIEV